MRITIERGKAEEVAAGADVPVIAAPWGAVPEIAAQLAGLTRPVVIDATKPIGRGFSLDLGPGGESGAERLAAQLPGARVLKAFKTVGCNVMADPIFERPAGGALLLRR